MGVFDNIKHIATSIAHGDLRGALGSADQAVRDAIGEAQKAAEAVLNSGGRMAGTSLAPPPATAPHDGGSCSGVVVPPPPSRTAPGPACCDRFRFDSGFLVDGATGSVWQYDQKSKSFEEVPVNHGKTKQSVIDSLVEDRLSQLRSQYEIEVLGAVAPAARAAKLAAFEKEYLKPLREAARNLHA